MNWWYVAGATTALALAAFIYCAMRGRWTRAGLAVGLGNLPIAFLNAAAPVRGWADPDYFGYSFGLIQIDPGPMVTLITGSIWLLAVYSACVAVLDRRGTPMRVVAVFDGLIAANVVYILVAALLSDPADLRIQLGEYLTLGPAVTTLILTGLFVVPLSLCSLWAWRRAAMGHGASTAPTGATA